MVCMRLDQMRSGQKAKIESLNHHYQGAQRLAEMGIIPGEVVTFLGRAPLGDPLRVVVMDYELCLRMRDAAQITISPLSGITPE